MNAIESEFLLRKTMCFWWDIMCFDVMLPSVVEHRLGNQLTDDVAPRARSCLLAPDPSFFQPTPCGSTFDLADTSEGPPPMPEDPENSRMF